MLSVVTVFTSDEPHYRISKADDVPQAAFLGRCEGQNPENHRSSVSQPASEAVNIASAAPHWLLLKAPQLQC